MKLSVHQITLHDQNLVLRPLTEADWDSLLQWNNDPDVLYFAEGDHVTSRSLAEVQSLYRHVSQTAFCFIIDLESQPIGECWLQVMNLDRIMTLYPNMDCRRIDLMIGEKSQWGRGYGTRVIKLLTRFAFEHEGADYVFGCDIADYNHRSRKAFEKAGYRLVSQHEEPPGSKARLSSDYMIHRDS